MTHSKIVRSDITALQKIKFGKTKIVISLLALITLAFAALFIGRYSLSPFDTLKILLSQFFDISGNWSEMTENVVYRVRLPRIFATILVGGGLALAGTTYQGIFRNPLVSPDLLGISAGACVGAASAILMNMNSVGIQTLALAGGLVAVFCSMIIPRMFKNDSTLMLVLSGVIVSGFMNAVIGILKYIADAETQLPEIIYWQMGSLAGIKPEQLIPIFPTMVIATGILILMRWRVNILSLGDTEAATLGVNLRTTRATIIIAATLLTGCSVCISGIVGWVGLVIPHLTRLIIGQNNTLSMPLSFIVGASFMLIIDTLARTLIASEIPLSILTGAIGAPLFIWLLIKTKTRL